MRACLLFFSLDPLSSLCKGEQDICKSRCRSNRMWKQGRRLTACVLASSLLVGCSERTGSDTHRQDASSEIVSSLDRSSRMCDKVVLLFHGGDHLDTRPVEISDSTQIGDIIDTLSLRSAKEYTGPDFAMGANTIIEVVTFQNGKETGRFEILGNMLYVQFRGKKHELRLESADAWFKLGGFARPANSREMPQSGSDE
jgi:hypothetical protein